MFFGCLIVAFSQQLQYLEYIFLIKSQVRFNALSYHMSHYISHIFENSFDKALSHVRISQRRRRYFKRMKVFTATSRHNHNILSWFQYLVISF